MNTLDFRNLHQNPKIQEFVRFCIVGTISSAIDAAVFYLLRLFAVYQVALICGYLSGLVFNYLMTIFWTFKTKPSKRNAIGVVTAHLINLFIIRMGLMWIFVNILNVNDKIAYIPTILISTIANFLMVRFAIHLTEIKTK